jgi:hypothetical protein
MLAHSLTTGVAFPPHAAMLAHSLTTGVAFPPHAAMLPHSLTTGVAAQPPTWECTSAFLPPSSESDPSEPASLRERFFFFSFLCLLLLRLRFSFLCFLDELRFLSDLLPFLRRFCTADSAMWSGVQATEGYMLQVVLLLGNMLTVAASTSTPRSALVLGAASPPT